MKPTVESTIRALVDDPRVRDLILTGSRVTTHSTPDSDWDYVVLLGDCHEIGDVFPVTDWQCCGHSQDFDGAEYACTAFVYAVFRHHTLNINLLVSSDPAYYKAMRAATEALRLLNLSSKEDRYDLFKTIKQLAQGNAQ